MDSLSGSNNSQIDENNSTDVLKQDEVICAEDLFGEPIKLERSNKPQEDGGAIDDNATQRKLTGDVLPAFRDLQTSGGDVCDAGSALMANAPVRDDSPTNTEIPEQAAGSLVSESLKAFFGEDIIDAGQETNASAPSYEYNMNHKHRGCFIIFNHMHFQSHLGVNSRKGTEEDKKNLEKTAKILGFEYVRSFDDLTAKEIFKWVDRIAAADHKEYDCFAMAVLSHGDEGDILYAYDAKYHIDKLTTPFMANNCPSLAGKPKMFFIQACRGVNLDSGALIQVANKSTKEAIVIPDAADFLLGFSTVSGYYAWRNQVCGSWFIQALCKCLREFAESMELMQVMTRVNRMVAYDFTSYSKQNLNFHGKKQIPSIVTRLTHEVFFRKKSKKCPLLITKPKHRLPVMERMTPAHDGRGEHTKEQETDL